MCPTRFLILVCHELSYFSILGCVLPRYASDPKERECEGGNANPEGKGLNSAEDLEPCWTSFLCPFTHWLVLSRE